MKYEWKKTEKQFYLPKGNPELAEIPGFKFFTIIGKGNPNDDNFSEYIRVLYSLSYSVKMSPKNGIAPNGYFDYSVYPLEGIWDLSEEAKKSYDCTLNKDELIFKLMIRQPDFVDEKFAVLILDLVKKKKPHALLSEVKFEVITDGKCIQMMHTGSYDDEPISFKKMEEFAEKENYVRKTKSHREVYISDARKVPVDKLRTVLRIFCREK